MCVTHQMSEVVFGASMLLLKCFSPAQCVGFRALALPSLTPSHLLWLWLCFTFELPVWHGIFSLVVRLKNPGASYWVYIFSRLTLMLLKNTAEEHAPCVR